MGFSCEVISGGAVVAWEEVDSHWTRHSDALAACGLACISGGSPLNVLPHLYESTSLQVVLSSHPQFQLSLSISPRQLQGQSPSLKPQRLESRDFYIYMSLHIFQHVCRPLC